MKKKVLFVLCALIPVLSVFSQEEKTPILVFNSLSLGVGPYSINSGISTIETFQKLAPNSKFLHIDLEGFSDSYYYEQNQTNTLVGAHAHFAVTRKDKSNHFFRKSLRVGIMYGNQSVYYDTYSKVETFTVDTVTSNSTGMSYPIDSTSTTRISMDYEQTQLFVDVAYLLHTKECNRFSLFGGAGVLIGFSVDANTYVQLNEDFTYSANSPNQLRPTYEDFMFREEVFTNRSGFVGAVSIPFGVDFRVGENSSFWKSSHLSAEIRPSISINQIPEISTEVSTAMIGMFTYRYQFR